MPIQLAHGPAELVAYMKDVQPCRRRGAGTYNPGMIRLAHNQQWDQVYAEIDHAKALADDYDGGFTVCHTLTRVPVHYTCTRRHGECHIR